MSQLCFCVVDAAPPFSTMPQDLILKIHCTTPAREVVVPVGRCSIGRGAENDVVINVTGISRRHAIIAHYSDGAQISDCGSQNGTFVNGRQIFGSVILADGDIISLGEVCEIRVATLATHPKSPVAGESLPTVAPAKTSDSLPPKKDFSGMTARLANNSMAGKRDWPIVPMVTLASITGIVLVVAAIIAWMSVRKNTPYG
jgi:hypothetical protein